ncbi:hypothetical protein F7725_012867 [Dissostichus mawsoni]|uniref:Uncharacterized protein n=1 Tax=Dissostichus mawsoni TaxID=36200 RepID=A0A7J5YNV7_DISMA|nr:hypothetical protein F7725_012867 [Dissostichus mawsoni]
MAIFTLSSHWKSGVMVSSTFSVERVMGCRRTFRAHVVRGKKLTNLIVVEVIETLKGEVLLLDLLDHFLWQLLELSQRGHGLPPVESRDTEHQRPASADKTKVEPIVERKEWKTYILLSIILQRFMVLSDVGCCVHQVNPAPLQQGVCTPVIVGDTVQGGVAEHTHIQHYLSIEHVRQLAHHLALYGQLLVEQRQVVLQLSVGCDQDSLSLCVVLRTSSSTKHLNKTEQTRLLPLVRRPKHSFLHLSIQPAQTYLQNVQGSELSPPSFLGAVHLSPFDDDGVSRQVDTPSQSSRGHQNLDVSVSKQILHQRTVHSGHTSVMDGEAVRQQILQFQVLEEEVQVLNSIPVIKVEESLGRIDPQAGSHILVVGQCGAEAEQTHILLGQLHVSDGPCHQSFQHGSAVIVQKSWWSPVSSETVMPYDAKRCVKRERLGFEGRHMNLFITFALFAERAVWQLAALVGHEVAALCEGQVFKVQQLSRSHRL